MLIKEAIAKAMKDLGVSSDDSSIGNRYVYMELKSIRNELLRQEIEKKGTWKNFPMQTLKRFEMKAIDIAESATFAAGEVVLKSVLKIPALVDTKDGKILDGVFLSTGERLELSSINSSSNSKDRRYKSNKPQVYFRDGYLLIRYYHTNTAKLYVDVDGLYENPEQVDELNADHCNDVNSQCIYYPDLPFHLPGYLEGRFFRMVKEDIAWTLRLPKDKVNNGNEDLSVQQIAQPQQNQ